MSQEQMLAEFMKAFDRLEFEPDGYGIKFSDQHGNHVACMIRDRNEPMGVRIIMHVGPDAVPCTAPPNTDWLKKEKP